MFFGQEASVCRLCCCRRSPLLLLLLEFQLRGPSAPGLRRQLKPLEHEGARQRHGDSGRRRAGQHDAEPRGDGERRHGRQRAVVKLDERTEEDDRDGVVEDALAENQVVEQRRDLEVGEDGEGRDCVCRGHEGTWEIVERKRREGKKTEKFLSFF